MIDIDVRTLASWVGGTTNGDDDVRVHGAVTTDSREIEPGGLFIAKRGETADGHAYVAAAAQAGAAAAIVEHTVDADIPQICVPDAVHALADLARAYTTHLRTHGALSRVLAITGSVGKTTTKHLLGNILQTQAPTIWPVRSYNNEVGVPLTVMRANETTRFLVLEMGASHIGDIRYLTSIAQPDTGCVLCVGLAHAGDFGGIENTTIAKREMVEAIPGSGAAVLNRDDVRVASMASASRAPVIWFGQGPDAHVRYAQVTSDATGIHFLLESGKHRRQVRLHLLGEHNASNAAAAIACALSAGIDFDDAVDALESIPAGERWRMQVMPRSDGVTIINDGYNANPASMSAAIHTLATLRSPGHRVVAVLGGMGELGDLSDEEHDRIGRLIVRLGIDQLVAVGEPARRIYLAANQEGSWGGEAVFVPDNDAAVEFVQRFVRPGDIVLTKSSMVYGLRLVGDRLARGDDA